MSTKANGVYLLWTRSQSVLTLLFTVFSPLPCLPQNTSAVSAKEFHGTIIRQLDIAYLLFTPKGYTTEHKWPLILYLHGGSLRGNDIQRLRESPSSLITVAEQDDSFPFIILAPQCPDGEYWTDTDGLIALLDEVAKRYPVDLSRVYLTGHSMGGFGTWYLAYKHPDRFAAIAPISAPFTITHWAGRLKGTPVWAFHGDKYNLVPIGGQQRLVEALSQRGDDARFTILHNRNHYILDVYQNRELYSWFLRHQNSQNSVDNNKE